MSVVLGDPFPCPKMPTFSQFVLHDQVELSCNLLGPSGQGGPFTACSPFHLSVHLSVTYMTLDHEGKYLDSAQLV